MRQAIGSEVEDFKLPKVAGGNLSLGECLAGKKGAVIVFWSGDCSHCVHYDPYLSSFSGRHPELGLLVVACRQGETREQIQAKVATRRLSFPLAHDASSSLAREWHTAQTPRAFLVGADRTLLYRGAIDNYRYPGDPDYAAYLEPAIDDFYAGRPVREVETASFGCAIQSIYYVLPNPL
jgi:hypothetical protein